MSWTQQDTSFKKLQNKRITTSTGKGINEEKGASTLELYLPDVKTEIIPGTPPGATTDVLYYTGAIGQTLVVDTSVPANLTWFATSGYGNTTTANDGSQSSEDARLMGWISDKYDAFGTVSGAGYEIKLYDKNSNLITKTDPSDWLFDYQTGILTFNNASTAYGAVATSGPFRIVGYRYIGKKGVITGAYGGLGFTTYTLGDILVGAGSTFIKLGIGSSGQYLIADPARTSGIAWTTLTVAATGLTTLNGLTASTQYFSVGTSGLGFNISSSGSTHTFNIPIAGTGVTGLITGLAQTIAGQKTFTSAILADLTGTATTATYALQSGYAITAGSATTATNINVVNAATNSAHPLYFGPVGTGSGVAVSSNSAFSFNPSTLILSTSGLAVTATTGSLSSTTGALTVAGGVGIGGSLNVGSDVTVGTAITGRLTFSQATFGSAGTTIIPSMAFIGATNSPITLSVLADNSLSFDGSSGQLFSINNNLSTGWIFAVNDISGLPLIRANADGTVAMGEFAGNIGIGLSNPSYKLHVNGDTNLSSGYVYRINGTSVLSSTQVLGLTVSSGNITSGTWSGTAISVPYGGTGLTSYTVGDILYAATSSSLGKLSAGTAGSVLVSAGAGSTPYYLGQLGLAAGTAVTSYNVNIVAATSNATHPLVFTPASSSLSGVAVSSRSTISFNPSTDIMSVSGLAVTASTASINSSTGALTVAGGVGIGGSLFSSSAFRNSISGVAISNGVVQSGSWAGSIITSLYGGTGYSTYTKGDLLVGAGNTLVKFPVGNDLTILAADSSAATGVTWKGLLAPTYGAFASTSTQPVTAANTTTYVNFNTVFSANNVSIGSGTTDRVYIYDSGVFDVQFSTQMSLSTGTQPQLIDMWFVVDGVPVPNSTTRQTVTGKDQESVLTVNLLQTFISGQYIQLAYSSPDPHMQLGYFSGLTSPTRPDIPSVILTVEPVSSILPGSGLAITGLASLNLLTANAQTLVTGTSGVDFNISSIGSVHTFNIPDASTTARGFITTGSQTLLGSKTFASGVAITATTASTGSTTGALIVSGGVGIGGSLFSSSSYANLISGIAISNGVIFSGAWAGSTITGFYGGTGYTNYTKGDLLVGAGNTFVKLSAGTNGYVLGANSALPAGLGWTTVSGVAISTSSPASPKNADLWFNSEDGSLSVYYQDTDTSQWVEIAVGSGIDLTNTVHITSSVGSTGLTTGALIVDGGVGIAGTVNAQSFVINELYDQIGTSLTTSTNTANQVALSLSSSAYRSAKIFVQASSGSTFHSQEILMVHDGSNVYMTEYSIVNTGAIGSTFDADLSGGNMRFLVTPTFAVTTYKIACTAMRI
jgi:hypothetical protein